MENGGAQITGQVGGGRDQAREDAKIHLQAAFREEKLLFPRNLIDFIDNAAGEEERAKARYNSYRSISGQILHREQIIPTKPGETVVLLYPPALYAYIEALFGPMTSEPKGTTIVTLAHLAQMTWE